MREDLTDTDHGLSVIAHSALKHGASLRITSYSVLLVQATTLLQNPLDLENQCFYSEFPSLRQVAHYG
jgi:hypothetical protein